VEAKGKRRVRLNLNSGDDDGPNPEKVNYALEAYLESL